MADRSYQLVLSALTRAAAESTGVPLFSTKTTQGLFPTTTVGKQAAQRSCEEGYLCPVSPDRAGTRQANLNPGLCTITEKGAAFLLDQASPRQILEDFLRVVEARESQVVQLVTVAREIQTNLLSLREILSQALSRTTLPEGDLKSLFSTFRQVHPDNSPEETNLPPAPDIILTCLHHWASESTQDCPLPDLYRQVATISAGVSIGTFHDGLRVLHDQGKVYLHPWTGPKSEMPCPSVALLIGHEIAYYASLRNRESTPTLSVNAGERQSSPLSASSFPVARP